MKTGTQFLKASAVVLVAIAIGVFAWANTSNISSNELSANASISTELLAVNTVDFDGKCGEGKCGEGKKAEKKEGAEKENAEKGESKCGEGKCGEGKKSESKKESKKEEKKEAKCVEGKCGGQ